MNLPQPLRSRDAIMPETPAPPEVRVRRDRVQTVLMLQGPASGFWSVLGQGFNAAGVRLLHVNLSLGDWVFWRGGGTTLNYRGSLARWEGWLDALVTREGVTDILYFADRQPYHLAAQRLARRRRDLRVWVVENGYLRPDWLTLEPFAMGRNSRFSRDPETLRRLAAEARSTSPAPPDLAPAFGHPFALEAACEVSFNLAHVFGRFAFPRYVSDKAVWPVVEYMGWLPRLWRARATRRHARRVERDCLARRHPVTFVALQLETDYQIRVSSDYASQSEMLGEVIASFARHAPRDMRLVLKVHPFDPGLTDWSKVGARIARAHGVAERVQTIRGGNFAAMMRVAHGVVTTNSTSGVTALSLGCPVRVMGDAVYDIPGLTHRRPLDSFWTEPQLPDPDLFDAWARAAADWIQIRGSLFHPEGQRSAAAEIVRRVCRPRRYWRLWRDPAMPVATGEARPAPGMPRRAEPISEHPGATATP